MELSELARFWKGLIDNPQAAFQSQKGKGGLGDASKIVIAISLVQSVFLAGSVFLFGTFIASALAKGPNPESAAKISGFLEWGAAAIFAGSLLLGVAWFFILEAAYFAIAKILRGRGSYGEQCYFHAIMLPLTLVLFGISLLFTFFGSLVIPCCPGLIALGATAYILYLYGVGVGVAHGLSLPRALAAVFVPAFILAVMALGLTALLFIGMLNAIVANYPSGSSSYGTDAVGFSVVRPVGWEFGGAGSGLPNSLYATNAKVAFENIAGVDLDVGINGNEKSKGSIVKFSKAGARECGWFGEVSVAGQGGEEVAVEKRGDYGVITIPAGRKVTVSGLITGPKGIADKENACGGPSKGAYRWAISFQTALDQYNIQHSDAGTITGKYA